MIGPHEGDELKHMLTGKKPAAMFHDVIPERGVISEEIIPEKAFAPYVENGTFLRFEYHNEYNGIKSKRVIYTLPDQAWRASALVWITQFRYQKITVPNDADDILIGMLLGYEMNDIEDFLRHRKNYFNI